jgi:hypothetical protein
VIHPPPPAMYTVSLHFSSRYTLMEMEQPTAAQAAAATAASIQALAEALQANGPPAASSHRLVQPPSGRRTPSDGSTTLKQSSSSPASPSTAIYVTVIFFAPSRQMLSLQYEYPLHPPSQAARPFFRIHPWMKSWGDDIRVMNALDPAPNVVAIVGEAG